MESITLNFWQFIAAFIAAMGIPSAVMGAIVHRLERRLDARGEAAETREKAQEQLTVLLVQGNSAAIALGEATARAVQRIPDAHCNGDMHAALDYAAKIKHEQKNFLAAQGIHALHQNNDTEVSLWAIP